MDIMTYHYKIDEKAVHNLCDRLENVIQGQDDFLEQHSVVSWDFSPRLMQQQDSILLALYIFHDLGIIGKSDQFLGGKNPDLP